MTLPPIPDTAADITAGWLTDGARRRRPPRRRSGRRGDARDRSAPARCATASGSTLTYDGATDAPAALVAKLPAADPTSRATAVSLRSYEKEVRFYQRARRRPPVATPTVFHADTRRRRPVELRPAARGPRAGRRRATSSPGAPPRWPRRRCTSSSASTRRGGAMPGSIDWSGCTATATPAAQMALMLLPTLWDGVPGALRDRPRRQRARGRRTPCSPTWPPTSRPRAGRETVVHGDYRLDNLLIAPDGRRAGRRRLADLHGRAGAQRRRLLHRRRPRRSTTGARTRRPSCAATTRRSSAAGVDGLRLGRLLDRLPAWHLRRAGHGGRRVDARGAHRPRATRCSWPWRHATASTSSTSRRPSSSPPDRRRQGITRGRASPSPAAPGPRGGPRRRRSRPGGWCRR